MKYQTIVNGITFDIEINEDGRIVVNDSERAIDFRELRQGELYSILLDHLSYEGVIDAREDGYHVLIAGDMFDVQVTDERSRRLASARMGATDAGGEALIRAPMPGLIVSVPVAEGDPVSKGQTVVVLESMKMENELKSPRDGTVHHVNVQPGDSVEQNKVLVSVG